ncbi:MAG: TonB-dependent receptor [Bacteroidetes bacterium]|nr:MAG: TonB-dependent receptor [Bacteroidota bacterium]
MRKIYLLLVGIVLFSQPLFAQKTVTGKVTDEKGDPLANVSIQVKGTNTGTTSKPDGTYSLLVPATGKVLVFTFVDMEPVEVVVGNQTSINTSMITVTKALQEVVVTGYQTVRKKDVASAISKISAAEIDNLPIPNLAQAMQGRAAGVAVSAATGIPGGNISVIIRGVGSINAGTTPLYVVDGIQINTGAGSINTQNNPLNFLNPDDIESIEILKDAAAASIYGARAANGVILVTTKRGKTGKPKITLNTYWGKASPLKIDPVLNTQQWYTIRREALINSGSTPQAATDATLAVLGLPAGSTQGKVDSLPTYEWQDAAFGQGTIFNAEASVSGGGQNVTYRVSASYSGQTAIIKPVDFERGAIMSNLNFKVNDKVSIENTLSISTFSQMAPYSVGNTGFGNPAYSAGQILTINPIYNPDGSYYGMPGSGQSIAGALSHNIVAVADLVKYFTRTNQFIGSAAVNYKPIPDLTIRSFIGIDYRLTQDHRYQDPRVSDGFAVGGRLSEQVDWNSNFITTTTANYTKRIKEDHNINALVGIEYRRDQNQWFQADAQGFPTYLLEYLSSASTAVGVSGQWTASATFSQFAKAGYTFRNKYVFNYTIRRDGSSRFGENNKYGLFQSAQVAWNVDQEDFIRKIRAFSTFKLRYSFGQAGNDQIGNTLYAQLYGATRLYGGGSGLFPSQLGNPDLTWETREENNIGLDLGFFKNRISLTVDAYKKVNKDLLLARSLYATTGFTTIQQNLGSLENKGLEILLTGTPLDGKFKWTTSFNIAFQSNKLLELYDGLQALPGDASIRVGYPIGSFFTSEWAGVNPATGRGMWYDKNGNLTYNPGDADRKIVGDIYPSHFGGWNNSFSYKGFTLEAFFQYEYGRIRQDQQFQQMMRNGGTTGNFILYGYLTRWQKPGDVVATPRPANNMTDYNSAAWSTGTRYLYKTDYIRLKQITIGYDLPPNLLKRFKLDGVKFYVQGLNLWTQTEWPGYDPEFTGANVGIIPQSKNITVGLQVRL